MWNAKLTETLFFFSELSILLESPIIQIESSLILIELLNSLFELERSQYEIELESGSLIMIHES